MKLPHLALAALLGLASPVAVAQAQYAPRPALHPRRHVDARYDPLAVSSQVLASEAADLARVARRAGHRSPLAGEARAFARSARAFQRAVESGAPSRTLRAALRPLRRSLRQLDRAAYHERRVDPRWLRRQLASMSATLERTAELTRADARQHRRDRWRDRAYTAREPYGRTAPRRPRAARFEIRVGL